MTEQTLWGVHAGHTGAAESIFRKGMVRRERL